MSTMICSYCKRAGIYWKDLAGLVPYTFCPHCGRTNCQDYEEEDYEGEQENEEAKNG